MDKAIYLNVSHLPNPLNNSLEGHQHFIGSYDVWYTIKHADDGAAVELTQPFEAVPLFDDSALEGTTCVVIGSRICMIGGTSLTRPQSQTSEAIYFIDTHRPEAGWKFRGCVPSFDTCRQAASVDDHWLVVFGLDDRNGIWAASFNVDTLDYERLPVPSHHHIPRILTCVPPGILHAYLYDEKHSSFKLNFFNHQIWTDGEGRIPDHPIIVDSAYVVGDDGILYMYDSCFSTFVSYDLRSSKKLYVVRLPRDHTAFPRFTEVHLLFISHNRFCIVWEWCGSYENINLYYSRFSVVVSEDQHKIVLEDHKGFVVPYGHRLVNAVAVAVGPSSGEQHCSSGANNHC